MTTPQIFSGKRYNKEYFKFSSHKKEGTILISNDKKIYRLSFKEIGRKRKHKIMSEPIEMVIVRGQQKFDLYEVLNPVQIQIKDDRILNMLKKHKNVYCKLNPINILFPASVINDTKQTFVTCRALNNVKIALINGKI